MKDWTYIKDGHWLPPQLKDVLFLTRSGKIYKGHLNLRNAWIMQNCDGLIARLMREESVIAWTDLPDADDPDWRTNPQPKSDIRVLAKDSVNNLIVIADIRRHIWIIRNMHTDDITFWMHDGSAWMPLPEVPAELRKEL